jgi:hypothetical protein
MTKFNDEFIKQVKSFWEEGKKQKKFKHDPLFSIHNVLDRFNLTMAQAKRILYVRDVNDT